MKLMNPIKQSEPSRIRVRDSDPLGRKLAGSLRSMFLGARLRFMRLGGNGVNRATHKI